VSTSDFPHLLYLGASLYVFQSTITTTFVYGTDSTPAVSVLTDLTCSLMPFPILWSLQIAPRKKIGVGLLMVMGAMYGKLSSIPATCDTANHGQCIRLRDPASSLSQSENKRHNLSVLLHNQTVQYRIEEPH
jgi:hypothetical protein